MATILPRRGTTAPTTGLTQYELAVDTTNKRIYIGNSGGSGDLIGSAPGGSDTQIQFNDGGVMGGDAGLTYNKTSDALSVAGDLNANGGALRTTQTTFNIVNTSATTVNIGGSATAINVGAATGTFDINNPTVEIGNSGTATSSVTAPSGVTTGSVFNTNVTTLNAGGAATTVTIGATSGTAAIRNATLRLGNTTSTITTNATAATNNITINPYGKIIMSPVAYLAAGGSIASLTVEATDGASGVVEISGGNLYLGRKTADDTNFTPVNIVFEGPTINAFDTTLTVETQTAARTITLPDADGTVGVMASPTNQQVQFYDSTSKNLKGDPDLTFDGSNLQIGSQGDLRFADSDSSNWVAFQAPATVASNVTWTLPSADGTSNQVLSTNGSGTLSWTTPSGGGLTWSAVTADQSLTVDTGVLANKSTGTLTLTLPTTAAVGKTIRVSGMQNTWKIAQNASQIIHFGKTDTTTGTGGYLQSTNARDAVELVCCVANNEWNVISSVGNITIV